MLILLILFLVLATIQVAFLFIFAKILFFKENKNNFKPSISIIVCSHNEYENLQNLIPLLLGQKYPNFEVIIVNDRSNDNSEILLNQIAQQYSFFKVIHIKQTPESFNPKKYALIQGIKASQKEFILLTDADCLPHSVNWISSMIQNLDKDKEIILGYSPYQKKKGFLNKLIQFETFYTAIQYFSFAIIGLPYMGVGRNLAYKKSLFLEKGSFGEYNQTTGGDDDLWIKQVANKKNVSLAIKNQESFVESVPKTTWKSFFWQKIRHISVSKHYALKHKILLGLLHSSHLFFWLIFCVLLVNISINSYYYYIFAIFVIREFCLTIIYKKLMQKFNVNLAYWQIPFFDIIYILYIFTIGISVNFIKTIQWKS